MNWTYDTTLRRSGLSAMSGTNVLQAAGYTHDTAGRLWKVSDGSVEAAYGYAANSSLMSSLTMTNSGAAGLVANRVWDRLGRLTSVSTRAYGSGAPGLPFGFEYQYNRANQRTRMKLADGSYWLYQFDALGQVISGKRYWSDGTPVAGQQFEYGFDDIGNRESTGGRASAASSYTNNLLNQITGRSVAPYVDVAGVANPTTNVTVSAAGQTFTAARRGDYFHHALSVPNSSAQYPTVEVTSAFTNWTESGQVYVPATPEVFTYDADGNLTSDGRWAYTWDGENRLVEMKRDAVSPSGARIWLVFEYDAQGRRIRKTVSTNAGGGWVEQTDAVFLYDGWNVMVELNANSGKARLRTYVWGSDLSGSLQGAGGVGGLLWVSNYQTAYQEETLPTGVHFVAYDGNGNVMALVKAADGTVSGRYEYGPFAEPVRIGGALAKAQPLRFSTKWTDAESGLIDYGFRYLNPTTGRWLSRDPIAEKGGANLYRFTRNGPILRIDVLGLDECETVVVLWVNDEVSTAFVTDVGQAIAVLATVETDTPTRIVWKAKIGAILGKAGMQKQKTFEGETFKNVFFVDVRLSSTPDKAGASFEGTGKNFVAIVWPGRVEMEFDLRRTEGMIPSPWDAKTGKEAYTAVSGLIIAHEVLHSLGAKHVDDPSSVMVSGDKKNRWLWLKEEPLGVDDENRKRVKKTLGVD